MLHVRAKKEKKSTVLLNTYLFVQEYYIILFLFLFTKEILKGTKSCVVPMYVRDFCSWIFI